MKIAISILLLTMLTLSCIRPEKDHANIHYYFTTTSDTTFEQLSFLFDFTRAHRNEAVRSVYLDAKLLSFDLDRPKTYYLGESSIEPEAIIGYDFGLYDFQVVNGTDTTSLKTQYNFSDFAPKNISPVPQQEIHLTFVLDAAASIVLDSAGQDWMKPRIGITLSN